MIRAAFILAALAAATTAAAQDATVVAARPIPVRGILSSADLATQPGATPGALSDVADAVGMETRVAIYQGRPVRQEDIGPPALVDRNATVTMVYRRGGLAITTEGRSLGRGGEGERVRVMNLDSRMTVTGIVAGLNLVEVR
jgi:flagella basal body P-ring formation protein FlgA